MSETLDETVALERPPTRTAAVHVRHPPPPFRLFSPLFHSLAKVPPLRNVDVRALRRRYYLLSQNPLSLRREDPADFSV